MLSLRRMDPESPRSTPSAPARPAPEMGDEKGHGFGAAASDATASDLELVERAREGERRAFEELVRRYHASLFVYTLSRTAQRSTAEDVVQETFFVAYRDLLRLRDGERFAGWIFGMADRLAARSRRSLARERRALERSHERRQPVAEASAEEETADREATRADDAGRLLRALGEVPALYRIPIVLRYYEGLNSAEIGQRLSAPAATVRSWLLRGNKMLKKALEGRARGGA